MPSQNLDATASIDQVVGRIQEHGYVIVENLVSESTMDQIEAELKPYVDVTDVASDGGPGTLTKRTGALIARSPTIRTLAMHPVVLGATKVLLSHSTSMHITLTETIFLWPGSQAQMLHTDELAFGCYPFHPAYEVQISTLWAMSEYTEEMGATRVVPGSHKAGTGVKFNAEDTIAAEMPRGSVLMYSGKTHHGSGENRSSRVRQALDISYAVGWVRQEENQYLSCPPEIARTLPEDLVRLLGYECSTNCGHVNNRLHPLSVVYEEHKNLRAVNPMPGNLDPRTGLYVKIDP